MFIFKMIRTTGECYVPPGSEIVGSLHCSLLDNTCRGGEVFYSDNMTVGWREESLLITEPIISRFIALSPGVNLSGNAGARNRFSDNLRCMYSNILPSKISLSVTCDS